MRILLLNQFYSPDTAATGQLLTDLGEELVKRGHTVHVLCSRRMYSGSATKLPIRDVMNGVNIHRVRATGFGRNKTLGRIIDYLSFYILAIWQSLWLPKVDVCISLTTPPFIAIIGLILRNLKGTRLVLWVMDLYPEIPAALGVLKKESFLYTVLAWFSRRLYSRSERIISLGEVMSKQLSQAGANPDKIVTVHNWVPREVVRPVTLG